MELKREVQTFSKLLEPLPNDFGLGIAQEAAAQLDSSVSTPPKDASTEPAKDTSLQNDDIQPKLPDYHSDPALSDDAKPGSAEDMLLLIEALANCLLETN